MATLSVKKRDTVGRNAARKLRHNGEFPGIIYGEKQEPVSIAVSLEDFKPHKNATVLELEVGSKKENVVIKQIQYDVFGEEILHVDFYRILMTKKLTVSVPVQFTGVPKGTQKGGKLSIQIRQMAVACFPNQIPEKITVSIENLDAGEQIKIKNLTLPPGVSTELDPEQIVALVQTPRAQPTAEAAPAEEGRKEPERITKPKAEEEKEE